MVKFDLHIHSCYSENLWGTRLFSPPSISLPEQIIKKALEKNIKVIAVTDHDNIQGSLKTLEIAEKEYKKQILVIPGVEVSSKDGHILAYNVYENIPKGLSALETINIIKKKGGVAVAAHPFNTKYSIKTKTAINLLNDFFAFELGNSHSLSNEKARRFIEDKQLAFTLGSDAHSLAEIGLCRGETDKKIKTVNDLLRVIKKKEVKKRIVYGQKHIQRIVPTALKALLYWKKQQIFHLFNKNIFLPYLEKKNKSK